jgi:hypothetical protein
MYKTISYKVTDNLNIRSNAWANTVDWVSDVT